MTTADPISLAQAQRLAANADTILLRATRPADLETPIGAFLRLDDGNPAYLLESVEGGERLGRYSFLGVGPRRLLEVRDGIARIQTRPVTVPVYAPDLPIETSAVADPLAAIRAFVPRRRVQPTEGMPRFTGGAVGALAYDAVSAFEPTVPLPERDPVGVPAAAFIETDLVLVFDHLTHTLSAIASLHTDAPNLESRYRIAEEAIFEALERSARPTEAEMAGTRGRGANGAPAIARPVANAARATGRDQPRPRRVHPRGRGRQGRHRGRRGDPGRPRPAPVVRPADGPRDRRAARRDRAVPGAPPGQPQPVPVLRPDAHLRGRRGVARAAPPGRGRPADDPPDRRDPAARRRRQRGRAAGRGAPARSEGARRARDAGRPRAQRPGPGRARRHGQRQQVHGGRALQPRPPPRVARGGAPPPGARRARRAALGLPGRHPVGRPEDPGDAAHRRGRGRAPRAVRRRRRLPRLRRQPRHRDHDPERGPQGRPGARPHRCRDRRGLGPREGVRGDRAQGGRAAACHRAGGRRPGRPARHGRLGVGRARRPATAAALEADEVEARP